MRKFFRKFIALFFLLLSTIVILNFLYINTNYWKNIVDIKRFMNVPEGIQIANVGSSHGVNSFDYDGIPYRAINFGLNAQRFFYDYAIIKQYINKFDKNAVLLIPVSYFQITMLKTDFRDQRARYYRFLDKENMDSNSIKENMLYVLFPVLTAGTTMKFIIKDQQPSTPVLMVAKEPELTRHSISRYQSWTSDRRDDKETREEGFAYNKSSVSQIITFCYTHDIQPILITTPITSVLNNILLEKTPDLFDDFYRFTRELQEIYPSLPYFDYSHDPRFENEFSLFRDSDHLNIDGARKFTTIVISDLQANGLLPVIE